LKCINRKITKDSLKKLSSREVTHAGFYIAYSNRMPIHQIIR